MDVEMYSNREGARWGRLRVSRRRQQQQTRGTWDVRQGNVAWWLHKKTPPNRDFLSPPSFFFLLVLVDLAWSCFSSSSSLTLPSSRRAHLYYSSRSALLDLFFSIMMATALDLHSLEQYCETLYNPSSQTSRIQVESLLNYHFPTFSLSSASAASSSAAASEDDSLLKGHSPSINTPIESALFCRSLLENTKNPFALMQVLSLSLSFSLLCSLPLQRGWEAAGAKCVLMVVVVVVVERAERGGFLLGGLCFLRFLGGQIMLQVGREE